MKNQLVKYSGFFLIVMFLMFSFAFSLAAQKRVKLPIFAPPTEDTSRNPHDFSDKFYYMNGINAEYIIGRRTGYDLMSVIGWSSNPYHSDVRILATLAAYGAEGEILFFSPLGEINDKGFTDDEIGLEAKALADDFPIYVFPENNDTKFSFGAMRQAPLMDASAFNPNVKGYPIGLRAIVVVNYTEKAFGDEGVEMMSYMFKKNGVSRDGTPLIRSWDDMVMLMKYELISTEKRTLWDDNDFAGTYSLNPIIYEPVKGVIAPDAFLMFVKTEKGEPLADEMRFFEAFNCLRKTGNWCSE